MVFGGGACGRLFIHKGARPLKNGISALTGRKMKLALLIPICHPALGRLWQENGITWEASVHRKRKRPKVSVLSASCEKSLYLKTSGHLVSWAWTFQAPDMWETNVCCLNHPVYGITITTIITTAQTDKDHVAILKHLFPYWLTWLTYIWLSFIKF